MFSFFSHKKTSSEDFHHHTDAMNHQLEALSLSKDLSQNVAMLEDLFADVDIMITRAIQNTENPDLRFCVYYSDGVVDSELVNISVIKPLLLAEDLPKDHSLFDVVRDRTLTAGELKETDDMKTIVESITYGDTLLLVDGFRKALIISSKSFVLRGISEPEGEKVLSGPRKGFNESLMQNLSLIRRRLRTHQLKLSMRTIGRHTGTSVCICYLEGIVNKKILAELLRRLDIIDIDGILDSNYITEHISETSLLGFPTCGYTERPDVVAAKLLEGRIALVVDGTPIVLTLPYLFVESFQSNEDYYVNHIYASFSRLLRFAGFFLTITVPAIFISAVAYHHELLPTSLMINFANERQGVPLPAALECFAMLIIFDILRETGVRTPSHIGQALSIVGALVIGQSAVEAKLVASNMIIVVAFTGITNLLVPKINSASLFCRYFLLILASGFGLTGMVLGISVILTHLLNLRSFGVPSIIPLDRLALQDVKDTFVRTKWPYMLTRLSPLSHNHIRSHPDMPKGKQVDDR